MTDLLDRLLDEADRLLPITVGDASDGEISAALLEVADHPMAVDVFIGLSRSGNERSIFAAIEMIGLTPDPAAMTEIVRAIADGLGFEDEVVGTIHATMVRRAADRGAHPGLRSHALLGALHLSQDSPARMFRLLSFLVDISTDDDATFLKHAAKVIGLVQAHRPEPELEAILGRIAGIDEVRDEAAMEIGLIELRRGLEGRNRVTALAAFSAAKDWFVEACAATEVRLDAELYGQSLGMLLDFQQGRRSGPAADEVAAIRQTAFEYAVYAAPASARLRGSWLVDRVSETMGWSTLAVTLGNLEDSLADTVWLDAMTVIERQLLNCYSASRSILRAGADGGVEEIVRPAIVDALQRGQTKLQMLEEWTRRNGASDMVADARALQACVVAAREASALRNPTEAAAPAGVAAVLSSGLVTPEMAKALDAFAFDNTKYFLDSVAPVVVSQWQELRNALAANADYASNADARRMLDFMLMRTLAWQLELENVERGARPWSDYLFRTDPKDLPDESDLQSDYAATMKIAVGGSGIRAEARGIAHGRADVVFDHGQVTIVAEMKKTGRNRSLAQLLDDHGSQATAYQRTGVRLALLIVLDLVDRGGRSDHFGSQSAVLETIPELTTTPYSVVVFRIQGRKRTPAKIV